MTTYTCPTCAVRVETPLEAEVVCLRCRKHMQPDYAPERPQKPTHSPTESPRRPRPELGKQIASGEQSALFALEVTK